ncbi:MAG: aconitase X catalytic domain-containing protein [Methanobacteriaceae archaeon]|nr:aconitase X catalytic domain-containing protein [Methanobacteriaceae archaeon]
MELTEYEEKMYNGEFGEKKAECMDVLVNLGKVYDAPNMIEITSAQVSGVSYKTIGEAGLEFITDLGKDVKVEISSMLNPAGVDLTNWESLGFSKEFTDKQIEITDGYSKLGVMNTCTCTPYLIGNVPLLNDHIAWSESSAVCYANSVLGARTNREGGPSALLAAICGRTPNYGYHHMENRLANKCFIVDHDFKSEIEYGALGYNTGKIINDGNPYFIINSVPSRNNLKTLGAALASSGSVSLYHVEDITPEANIVKEDSSFDDIEVINLESDDIINTVSELSTTDKIPDLVCLGCPHASLDEIKELSELLKNKTLKKDLWICTSIAIKSASDQCGFSNIIESAGGKIVCDTCMVVAPVEDLDYEVIGVNSAKAANYIPSMCKLDVVYASLSDLISMIT